MELPTHGRMSLYNKILRPGQIFHPGQNPSSSNTPHDATSSYRKSNNPPASDMPSSRTETPIPREGSISAPPPTPGARSQPAASPSFPRRVSYAVTAQPNFVPVMESVNHVVKNTDLGNIKLPEQMTTDDFTRAVAVATVSALRHQQVHGHGRARAHVEHDTSAGHDAPSWSRFTSASVLLGCTFLYALIAGMSAPSDVIRNALNICLQNYLWTSLTLS